jgi:hypothetical protein
LSTHLFDTVETLTKKGLSEEEAFEVAKIRLGKKDELVDEFQKVNGINMLNKEWVFVFIGVALCILIKNILETISIGIGYYYSLSKISLATASFLTSFAYLLIATLVIILFKRGNQFSLFFREKVFDKNGAIISVIATLIGLAYLIPVGKLWGNEAYRKYQDVYSQIVYSNPIAETIIRATIPTIIILSIFLSTQSVNKKISWQTIYKSDNYFYIFMLGFGLEALAALFSRMTFGGDWYSPIIFGLIYFFGVLGFLKYNSNNSYLKLITFIAFTTYFEITWGYFTSNLSPNMCTLKSPFAWAVIIAIILAFFTSKKMVKTAN